MVTWSLLKGSARCTHVVVSTTFSCMTACRIIKVHLDVFFFIFNVWNTIKIYIKQSSQTFGWRWWSETPSEAHRGPKQSNARQYHNEVVHVFTPSARAPVYQNSFASTLFFHLKSSVTTTVIIFLVPYDYESVILPSPLTLQISGIQWVILRPFHQIFYLQSSQSFHRINNLCLAAMALKNKMNLYSFIHSQSSNHMIRFREVGPWF